MFWYPCLVSILLPQIHIYPFYVLYVFLQFNIRKDSEDIQYLNYLEVADFVLFIQNFEQVWSYSNFYVSSVKLHIQDKKEDQMICCLSYYFKFEKFC